MLEKLPQPVIFAHRGASAYAPENTMSAFRLAAEQGVEAIELDAKLTADGEVVVIHDMTVDRTTNGHGEVRCLRLDEIRRLDAGAFFSETYRGEKIPLLREVFQELGQNLFINVELTNYNAPLDSLPIKVAQLVREYHLEQRVLFSSFNPWNLIRIRRLLPECPVALLALEGRAGWLARSNLMRWISPRIIHPYLVDVTPDWIVYEHRRGRRVHVWTVNRAEDLESLFRWGVDGVFTDDPVLAMQIRSRMVKVEANPSDKAIVRS
ncbi:glycerophosphodiester phosphodiesterase family protein [uncultured Thermanaerothrix sp.]|uniref:glycerophosphodiester phosphodiesterase n=1 Tax=uncultured Thermanaerothrix sp. TaxID=1195149 RepID=UPI002631370F|nr:glycerophosphodiester phosphodiesterase family protein [uncultured Thermanaerothrix sp.]